jgi:hypothetical protein
LPRFALSIAILLTLGADIAHAGKKVVLCHVPPGNPANAHTILVGEAAISAHPPRDCTVADKCVAGFCDPATGACGTTPVSCLEECDPPDFKGETCETVLGAGATETLSCSANCTLVSQCQLCGNGVREGTEVCDGAGPC